MTEVVKAGSTSTSSVQSTPTPPSSGQSARSRRSARKCATPIKSAEKVDKDERVSLHQLSLTDTSSTNTTITPDSSNLTKVQVKVGEINAVCCVHIYMYLMYVHVHNNMYLWLIGCIHPHVEIGDSAFIITHNFADSASLAQAARLQIAVTVPYMYMQSRRCTFEVITVLRVT